MDLLVQSALIYFCYLAVPVICLIFLFKIKKSLWFTLPIALAADIVALWPILSYYEFRGLAILMIFYQLVVISMLIALFKIITAFRRKYLKKIPDGEKISYFSKEKRIIIAVCVIAGIIVAGIVTHNILLGTSDKYNQIFDKQLFSELIKIDANDIIEVELIYARAKLEEGYFDFNYYGDKSFINDLEFDGSRLKNPAPLYGDESCSARFITKNGGNILFMTGGGDRFLVHYKNREFYVKSPQLWEDVNQPRP